MQLGASVGSTLTTLHLTGSALEHRAYSHTNSEELDGWLTLLFAAATALLDVSLSSFVITKSHATALRGAASKQLRRLSLDDSSLEQGVLDLIFPAPPSTSSTGARQTPHIDSTHGSTSVSYPLVSYPLQHLSIKQCRMREWLEVTGDYVLREVRLADKDLTNMLTRLPQLRELLADTQTSTTRWVKLDAFGDPVMHALAGTAKHLEVRTPPLCHVCVQGARG
jgi:hypothetical protein